MPQRPWWEHESGLLHPSVPLEPLDQFPSTPTRPALLHIRETERQVVVRFPLGSSWDALDVRVRLGRLMLMGEHHGVQFTRALTLPNNLDLVHQRIQIHRGELRVVIHRYPDGAWRRSWTQFRHWILAKTQRFWAWWSGASEPIAREESGPPPRQR